MPHYAYLHGFASSPLARKGQRLCERFAEWGRVLHLPDLNRPSFSELTYSGALAAVDELVDSTAPDGDWRFVGSSMGGYLAARWAELHPQLTGRLLLLCPSFDLPRRWPQLVGAEVLESWRREGRHVFPDGTGLPTAVHWGFVDDARRHPAYPRVLCATLIIHGRRDAVVSIECSRHYTRICPQARLLEVDDAHDLMASMALIEENVRRFLCHGDDL